MRTSSPFPQPPSDRGPWKTKVGSDLMQRFALIMLCDRRRVPGLGRLRHAAPSVGPRCYQYIVVHILHNALAGTWTHRIEAVNKAFKTPYMYSARSRRQIREITGCISLLLLKTANFSLVFYTYVPSAYQEVNTLLLISYQQQTDASGY